MTMTSTMKSSNDKEELLEHETLQNKLASLPLREDRAKYLLSLGVSSMVSIIDSSPIAQACVRGLALPVFATDEEDIIEKGEAWLRDLANPSNEDKQ